MLAEIITIGDELLIGQVVDTNSAFIAKQLNKIGVSVYQITSIQDDKDHILQALADAENRVDIIICTGGLGPTKDDITKKTIAEYFNDTLLRNSAVLENIEYIWKQHVRTELLQVNKDQALIPSKSNSSTGPFFLVAFFAAGFLAAFGLASFLVFFSAAFFVVFFLSSSVIFLALIVSLGF